MTIKKWILLMGLCVLFTGCSTGRFPGETGPVSTTDMGERYLLGRGVPQNNAKAFSYFTQAANEGNPFAQNELAYMYAAGKGTKRDDAKALFWYRKAANNIIWDCFIYMV